MGFKLIEVTRERRTYITGQFRGKYWSEYDSVRSDGIHEDFYDINLYEADIAISAYRQSSEGPFTDTPTVSEYVSRSFPNTVRCSLLIDGETKHFNAEIHEPIVTNLSVVDVRQEEEQSFGTLIGDVYGFLIDQVKEMVEVEEPEPILEKVNVDNSEDEGENIRTGVSWLDGALKTWQVFQNPLSTNNSGYAARDTLNDRNPPRQIPNSVSTHLKTKAAPSLGRKIWDGIIALLSLAVGLIYLLALVSILFSAWPAFIVIAGLLAVIYGLNWLLQFHIARKIGTALIYLLLVITVFGFLKALDDALNTANSATTDRITDVGEEQPAASTIVEESTTSAQSDSLIRHYRVWADYSGTVYKGWLVLPRSAFIKARQFREHLPFVLDNNDAYDQLFDTLATADTIGLRYTYATFDSLRRANNLSPSAFANLLVSCVQDIPYTILLPADCNPRLYQDAFTQRYLSDGGLCEGYVKYGLHSPQEFLATLKGDCDTRTLLLYTILKHYRYDVIVLNNTDFGHSLLAINLPGVGSYREYVGKRYYIWETTAPGMVRGQRPAGIPDLSKWHIIDEPSLLQ